MLFFLGREMSMVFLSHTHRRARAHMPAHQWPPVFQRVRGWPILREHREGVIDSSCRNKEGILEQMAWAQS